MIERATGLRISFPETADEDLGSLPELFGGLRVVGLGQGYTSTEITRSDIAGFYTYLDAIAA